ncbi:MAG: hypothetical protein F6K19_03785 [Cyanothece sp. SIO1E1]|nr:hypothetical protein [Cyanothece sp. SIO1E1]
MKFFISSQLSNPTARIVPSLASWLPGARPTVMLGAVISIVSMLLVGCDRNTVAISSPSSESFEVGLAQHLQATGARMYGAYWCPHCHNQKEMFGKAASYVPYIECDPKGNDSQTEVCQAKEIKGYPTWEIGNQLYPGIRSLASLADISNYTVNPDQ